MTNYYVTFHGLNAMVLSPRHIVNKLLCRLFFIQVLRWRCNKIWYNCILIKYYENLVFVILSGVGFPIFGCEFL